ncbi:MAG: tRNA1(Val) (adenine(37)-N6)-methyltransferase [Ignavibacteriaceae bacterium]|nr:tRNA1(Val) (adenine(37)-N6)-methyltransferase [Ignavibacteriaceae bacterium]
MCDWVLGAPNLKTVLEPAFGLGIFARSLLRKKKELKITGIEKDPVIYEFAKKYFSSIKSVDVQLHDYLFTDWKKKYDGIICNPPYFKFHDYENKESLTEIEKNLGLKLTGFTNLYSLFLLKSISQLAENGRAAYIIPSEFMNADYGIFIKEQLLLSKTLRHIIVFDFEENLFDDALTTSSILLFANDGEEKKININKIRSIDELHGSLKDSGFNSLSSNEIDPKIKWKTYYHKRNGARFKGLVPFAKYGKVMRGIATGSNGYFVFNEQKAEKYQIPKSNLLRCVSKSADIKTNFFTDKYFSELSAKNRPVYLLDVKDAHEINTKKYLEHGVALGINKKYLTSRRNPWYAQEARVASPIWVSVFNRTGLKFVKNEAGASNLTTFHCVYFQEDNLFQKIGIDLFFSYLITETAREIFKDNSRQYGNGLQKYEPNDLNKAQVLDLELLPEERIDDILNLYHDYRLSVISGRENEALLEELNEKYLEFFL